MSRCIELSPEVRKIIANVRTSFLYWKEVYEAERDDDIHESFSDICRLNSYALVKYAPNVQFKTQVLGPFKFYNKYSKKYETISFTLETNPTTNSFGSYVSCLYASSFHRTTIQTDHMIYLYIDQVKIDSFMDSIIHEFVHALDPEVADAPPPKHATLKDYFCDFAEQNAYTVQLVYFLQKNNHKKEIIQCIRTGDFNAVYLPWSLSTFISHIKEHHRSHWNRFLSRLYMAFVKNGPRPFAMAA